MFCTWRMQLITTRSIVYRKYPLVPSTWRHFCSKPWFVSSPRSKWIIASISSTWRSTAVGDTAPSSFFSPSARSTACAVMLDSVYSSFWQSSKQCWRRV